MLLPTTFLYRSEWDSRTYFTLFFLVLFSSKFILADYSWTEVLCNFESSYSVCTTVHRPLFLSPCSLQSFITDTVAGHTDNGLHSKKVACVFELISTPFIWNLVLWGKEIQCGFFSLFQTGSKCLACFRQLKMSCLSFLKCHSGSYHCVLPICRD